MHYRPLKEAYLYYPIVTIIRARCLTVALKL